MHVTPSELRMVRQDRIVARFALLDTMAFVLAETHSAGSRGSSMEQPCVKPHWGFVIAGEVEFESDSRRETIAAGSAFHVPAGGPPHRFFAHDAVRIAGFEPIDPAIDTTDSALEAQGFAVLNPEQLSAATVIPPTIRPLPEPKQIDVRAWPMSSLVMTQARFGPGSGYTTDWCDAPHWGLVTSGRIAIEWEDDIEILAAGDVYHCPAGPPGHRLEAADPASVVDLTPQEVARGTRVAPWRVWPTGSRSPGSEADPIAVAGLG
jgi:quercetin dioxygenase-like cupin family protein